MNWDVIGPVYGKAIVETLIMVVITLIVGGFAGLMLGLGLYATRRGGVMSNSPLHTVLNVVVNIVRPIPFIIFVTAVGPLTLLVMGTTIGTPAATFALCLAATFGISRIVEQNLVGVDPGVVEAARAMGAGPWRILFTVVIPEALGPLILGYTFVFVAVVDMTAVAGAVAGGGLGQFAISYGYQRFNWAITGLAVVTIIVLVQIAQFTGNTLARKVMRR
jgi:D-methionine transport system permease protein